MKKLFTLLTLALMSIGSAWAATEKDLKTISGSFTFIADDITSNGTVKLTANTLYADGYIFAPTANAVAINKGNSTIGGEEHLNSLRLKNTQDQLIFKVDGPCSVTFYTQSHASRGIQVGSKAGGTEYGSQDASTTEWTCNITAAGFVYLSSYSGDFYFAGFTVTPSSGPQLGASPTSLNFALTPSSLTKSEKFTVTGKNLTDGSYDLTVPSVDGLSVSPTSFTVADGEVEQEFEVTYTSDVDVAANSATISATVDGESFEVTVNYSARTTPYEQTDVTGTATWDWTKLKETVELGAETTPIKDTEVLLAEFDSQIDFSAFGNAQAIVFKGQFPSRNGFAQGSMLKFTTTVSGTITVEYSNTGGSNKNRWLTVNGIQFGDEAVGTTKRSATSHVLPAGDIVISTTSAYLRFFTVTFTPAEMPTTASATIGTEGWATLYTYYNLDFSTVEGLTAYTATCDGATVTLTEVEDVPAGTGVVLQGAQGNYTIPVIASSSTAKGHLQGAATATAFDAFEGYTLYVLTKESEKDAQFAPVDKGEIAAGKAFLKVAASGESRLNVVIAGETTGIKSIEAQEAQEGIYNLQGQRVAKAQKGLYIVNGKKAIVK